MARSRKSGFGARAMRYPTNATAALDRRGARASRRGPRRSSGGSPPRARGTGPGGAGRARRATSTSRAPSVRKKKNAMSIITVWKTTVPVAARTPPTAAAACPPCWPASLCSCCCGCGTRLERAPARRPAPARAAARRAPTRPRSGSSRGATARRSATWATRIAPSPREREDHDDEQPDRDDRGGESPPPAQLAREPLHHGPERGREHGREEERLPERPHDDERERERGEDEEDEQAARVQIGHGTLLEVRVDALGRHARRRERPAHVLDHRRHPGDERDRLARGRAAERERARHLLHPPAQRPATRRPRAEGQSTTRTPRRSQSRCSARYANSAPWR